MNLCKRKHAACETVKQPFLLDPVDLFSVTYSKLGNQLTPLKEIKTLNQNENLACGFETCIF